MGTGLAATIMGSQAGLEQEKMGLENLYKGMQMPGEILKGQEQAMLLQDPNYLQQKTANTMIELGNQYDAGQFQQSLNAFGRVKIQLQAATGDPQKQQQIVLDGLKQLNMDPNSEFGRYALANPDKAIDQLIQGTEAAAANAGVKFPGEMVKQNLIGKQHMDVAKYNKEANIEAARVQAGVANSRLDAQEQREVTRARRGLAFKDPVELEQGLTSALNNGIDPVTFAPLTPESKKYYETMLASAKDAVAKKQKTINFNFGNESSQTPAPATPGQRKPLSSF